MSKHPISPSIAVLYNDSRAKGLNIEIHKGEFV